MLRHQYLYYIVNLMFFRVLDQQKGRKRSQGDRQDKINSQAKNPHIIDLTQEQVQVGKKDTINIRPELPIMHPQQQRVIDRSRIEAKSYIFRNVTGKLIVSLHGPDPLFNQIIEEYPQYYITQLQFMEWLNRRQHGANYFGVQLFKKLYFEYERSSNVRLLFKYLHTKIKNWYDGYVNTAVMIKEGKKDIYKSCARQISQYIQTKERQYNLKQRSKKNKDFAPMYFRNEQHQKTLKSAVIPEKNTTVVDQPKQLMAIEQEKEIKESFINAQNEPIIQQKQTVEVNKAQLSDQRLQQIKEDYIKEFAPVIKNLIAKQLKQSFQAMEQQFEQKYGQVLDNMSRKLSRALLEKNIEKQAQK